jgi:hypothetical protein
MLMKPHFFFIQIFQAINLSNASIAERDSARTGTCRSTNEFTLETNPSSARSVREDSPPPPNTNFMKKDTEVK